MAISKRTRREWFNLGATKYRGWTVATGLAFPQGGNLYPCPLCGKTFRRSQLGKPAGLSVEDVPPKSVGGAEMLLTCQPCNNDQGGHFDKRAIVRERWLDTRPFAHQAEALEGPVQGQHTMSEVLTSVQIWPHGDGDNLGIGIVPEFETPEERTAFEQALRDPANTTFGLHYTVHVPTQMDPEERKLSDLSSLRAAYLASCAALGWTQVFRPTFLPLVARLAGDKMIEVPQSLVRVNDEEPAENLMLLVTEEGPQQGMLLVQMGRAVVIFPGPDDNRSLMEVADVVGQLVRNGDERSFNGLVVEWPVGPRHALDPDPPADPELPTVLR